MFWLTRVLNLLGPPLSRFDTNILFRSGMMQTFVGTSRSMATCQTYGFPPQPSGSPTSSCTTGTLPPTHDSQLPFFNEPKPYTQVPQRTFRPLQTHSLELLRPRERIIELLVVNSCCQLSRSCFVFVVWCHLKRKS